MTPDEISQRLGAWARQSREAIELTYEDMAAALDISVPHLRKMESGNAGFRLSTILDIAVITGASPVPTIALIVEEHMNSAIDKELV